MANGVLTTFSICDGRPKGSANSWIQSVVDLAYQARKIRQICWCRTGNARPSDKEYFAAIAGEEQFFRQPRQSVCEVDEIICHSQRIGTFQFMASQSWTTASYKESEPHLDEALQLRSATQ